MFALFYSKNVQLQWSTQNNTGHVSNLMVSKSFFFPALLTVFFEVFLELVADVPDGLADLFGGHWSTVVCFFRRTGKDWTRFEGWGHRREGGDGCRSPRWRGWSRFLGTLFRGFWLIICSFLRWSCRMILIVWQSWRSGKLVMNPPHNGNGWWWILLA